MRISFVIQNLSAGGAERVASMLANRWSELGHEVTLLTFEAPGALSHYPSWAECPTAPARFAQAATCWLYRHKPEASAALAHGDRSVG